MNITNKNVVSINYRLTNAGGEELDKSEENAPLVYLHGVGQMIPGLEEGLDGKTKGEKLQLIVSPDKGYGEANPELVQTVPKEEFADVKDLAVGMQFQVDTPQGPMIIEVTEVKETEVVVDGNHPLAGETLHFDVEIVDIREATEEELAHGHVHGPGGHQH